MQRNDRKREHKVSSVGGKETIDFYTPWRRGRQPGRAESYGGEEGKTGSDEAEEAVQSS